MVFVIRNYIVQISIAREFRIAVKFWQFITFNFYKTKYVTIGIDTTLNELEHIRNVYRYCSYFIWKFWTKQISHND